MWEREIPTTTTKYCGLWIVENRIYIWCELWNPEEVIEMVLHPWSVFSTIFSFFEIKFSCGSVWNVRLLECQKPFYPITTSLPVQRTWHTQRETNIHVQVSRINFTCKRFNTCCHLFCTKHQINVYFNKNTCKVIQFACYFFWFGLYFALVKSLLRVYCQYSFPVYDFNVDPLPLLFMFVSSRLMSHTQYTHTHTVSIFR